MVFQAHATTQRWGEVAVFYNKWAWLWNVATDAFNLYIGVIKEKFEKLNRGKEVILFSESMSTNEFIK